MNAKWAFHAMPSSDEALAERARVRDSLMRIMLAHLTLILEGLYFP